MRRNRRQSLHTCPNADGLGDERRVTAGRAPFDKPHRTFPAYRRTRGRHGLVDGRKAFFAFRNCFRKRNVLGPLPTLPATRGAAYAATTHEMLSPHSGT